MSGTSQLPKTGYQRPCSANQQIASLELEKEVVDMKQTDQSTTVHATRTTTELNFARLLVLIPKEYLANLRLLEEKMSTKFDDLSQEFLA